MAKLRTIDSMTRISLVLALIAVASAQGHGNEDVDTEASGDDDVSVYTGPPRVWLTAPPRPPNYSQTGSFPIVNNLATRARISTNATCGTSAPETYCKLVEHVRRLRLQGVHCGVCDSSDPYNDHPITNAIDGSHGWWQSPTIANGAQFHWVTIDLDLGQVYQVAYVVLTAANSPRPGNWILERSKDGIHYKPWQYFAVSDSECWTAYDVRPVIGRPRFKADDDVICTSYYSRLDPLTNGEIHTSLINGRPGASGPSKELLEFTAARYIRIRLQKIRTLNADLMTFISNPRNLDSSVTNRYFYSLKDISVGGQCVCHGHARQCPIDQITGSTHCVCEGNTCGGSCEYCCPLFNQLSWRPGTYKDGAFCEECQCFNHAKSCVFNQTVANQRLSLNKQGLYEGGGVCVNCEDHTMGVNCELCQDGYYRPRGVFIGSSQPCLPCLCDGPGSIGTCVKDDTEVHDPNVQPGDCFCKVGYCGPRCMECDVGYKGYPHCEPCLCSAAGSSNEDPCSSDCICKPNVEGASCDVCKENHFNLERRNPLGCTACYCFGKTQTCQASPVPSKKLNGLSEWTVVDLHGKTHVIPQLENTTLLIHTKDTTNLGRPEYWSAPKKYIGNKITSYGGLLEYAFIYEAVETKDTNPLLANYDVIVEGSGYKLGYGGHYFEPSRRHVMQLNLTERRWTYLQAGRGDMPAEVTREVFLQVLSGVERLLIRANFHEKQILSRLLVVSLDVTDATGNGAPLTAVEVCSCPTGYKGTSCEDCRANTDGPQCQRCALGFYRREPTDPCVPCSCPMQIDQGNFFALECVADPAVDSDDPGGYKCSKCAEGYEGSLCQTCSNGYYGNPLTPGGSCNACNCSGNLDLTKTDACDPVSGECVHCNEKTEGEFCEVCADGYWGDAVVGECKYCDCDSYGSENLICNSMTGQCDCKPRYTGRQCGRCVEGHGNVAAGCPPCSCYDLGSTNNNCNAVSGQCSCKSGVGGLQCDRCSDGFYDFGQQGCKACPCTSIGINGTTCDEFTGQCRCLPNVVGLLCDHCEVNHFGLQSGTGCQDCACDEDGAASPRCDVITGQCQCKVGVAGRKCDECLPGYYGLTSKGCKVCPVCAAPGQVCDVITGDCICPPNTEGRQCETCAKNSWGHDPLKGCKTCSCNLVGSTVETCDSQSGQCPCQPAFSGLKCDQCRHGYYNFPMCKPCDCDAAGSAAESCQDGVCQCDETGKCPCKSTATGRRCDSCVSGSFGLSEAHPSGCTECFCFNRGLSCKQANFVWSQKILPDQINLGTDRSVAPLVRNGQLILSPDDVMMPELNTGIQIPVYRVLPTKHLGDLTTSYNGYLTFTHNFEAGPNYYPVPSRSNPLAYLQGNIHINLKYNEAVSLTPNFDTKFALLLREDAWTDLAGKAISRVEMMVALQHVQEIRIKMADSVHILQARLTDIRLDVAVPNKNDDQKDIALGIEKCHCHPHWSSLSCQDPSLGRYRKRNGDGSDPVSLLGKSVPCECNGHSDICDRETGHCKDCQHFTVGTHCEKCKAGYYGNATGGTSKDCQQCACPRKDNSRTCVSDINNSGEFICDQCSQGYEGQHCETCAFGYYGNPLENGGLCRPCGCNPDGSVSQDCNKATGACSCRRGIQGHACDRCEARFALVHGNCTSCDEGCPGILMADLDDFMGRIDDMSQSAAAYLPWKTLLHKESEIGDIRGALRLRKAINVKDIDKTLTFMRVPLDELKIKADRISSKAKMMSEVRDNVQILTDETTRELADAKKILSDGMEALTDMENARRTQKKANRNPEAALKEAKDKLEEMKNRDLYKDNIATEDELIETQSYLSRMDDLALRHTNTSGVEQQVAAVKEKLKDMLNIVKSLSNQNAVLGGVQRMNDKRLNNLKNDIDEIQRLKDAIDEANTNSSDKNDKTSDTLWKDASKNIKDTQDGLQELVELAKEVDKKSDLLAQNMENMKSKAEAAEDKAAELNDIANGLQKQFNVTKVASSDAIKAATAYDSIAKDLEEAAKMAADAKVAAANTDVVLKSHEIEEKLEKAKSSGEKQLQEAESLANANKDLKKRLENDIESQRKIKNNLAETNKNLEKIKAVDMAREKPRDSEDIDVRGAIVSGIADAVKERAKEVERKTNDNLKKDLEELKKTSKEDLDNSLKSVQKAKNTFNKLMNLVNDTNNDAKKSNDALNSAHENFDELKELIRRAREEAQNIKISLSTSGKCARKYESAHVRDSITNSISLHFKTPDASENGLLFLLNSPHVADYLAVELVNRRVRFAWDVGGGVKVIQHPLVIENSAASNVPLNGKLKSEPKWYRVAVSRVSNYGRLSVSKLNDDDSSPVSSSGADTHSTMNLGSEPGIYIAGALDDVMIPPSLSSRTFKGCVGDVKLDGHPIGLYNFRALSGRDCSGCPEVPSTSRLDDAVQLGVCGHSSVEPILRFDPFTLGVNLAFKTFTDNAVLFLTENEANGHFMSLSLQNGFLLFQFKLDNGIERIRSKQRYNSNQWVFVKALRDRTAGVLDVGSERLRKTVSGEALQVQGQMLHFAGHPKAKVLQRYGLQEGCFLGCLKDVQMTAKGTRSIVLTGGAQTGLQAGCGLLKSKELNFTGEGYMEVGNANLAKNGSLSFIFRTLQDDALLLMSKTKLDDVFYSVSLSAGKIYVWMNGGGGLSEIASRHQYNDGTPHSVSIIKEHRQVTLYVDDQPAGFVKLPSHGNRFEAMGGAKGGLFLGGVPVNVDATAMAASTRPLAGCLMDLVFHKKSHDLDNPIAFSGVTIGTCSSSKTSGNTGDSSFPAITYPTLAPTSPTTTTTTVNKAATTPTTPKPKLTTTPPPPVITEPPRPPTPAVPKDSCAAEHNPPRIAHAVAFGDIKNSHAQIVIPKREVNKNFAITVEFRTWSDTGLLFYATNKEKSADIGVEILGGKLKVSFDDRGVIKQSSSNVKIDDGKWHTVYLNKTDKFVLFEVDQEGLMENKITRQVDVTSPIYVGGVSHLEQVRAGLISESFKGCIRKFVVNKRSIDIESTKSVTGVRRCFKDDEPGAFFDGDGYVAYRNSFSIKTQFRAELSFRTVNRDGILFSISDPKGAKAMALELRKGQLLFTVKRGDVWLKVVGGACKYCLCDGNWHQVEAEFAKNVATLRIDGGKMKVDTVFSPKDLDLSSELFVGGFPDYAKPQAATSQSNIWFRGCLRHVIINQKKLRWHDVSSLVDVHVAACPQRPPQT